MSRKDYPFIAALAAVVLMLFAPGLFDVNATTVNFGDLPAYHHPLRFLAAGRIQDGSIPFWNPYIFSGTPNYANPQVGTFYPGSLFFWIFPVNWAFTAFAAAHFFWAALGTFLWARSTRVDRIGAFVLAMAFAFSAFLVYRIPQGVPTHLAGLSFIPWCWMALQANRPWLLGGLWAIQVFGTHPQFPFLNTLAMGLYTLCRPKTRLPIMIKAGVLAIGLCAIQLLPLLKFAGNSSRQGMSEFFFNAYSQPLKALLTLINPAFWGDPLRGTFAGSPSEFYEEFSLYIGLVPLVLALIALTSRQARIGWGLVCAGVFLSAGRFNPLAGLLGLLPLIGYSRTPARFSVWTLWGLIFAASWGWKRITNPRFKAALLALAFIDLVFWAGRAISFEDARPVLRPSAMMRKTLAGKPIRFSNDPEIANPNKAMLYRARNTNGYDSFFLGNYVHYSYRAEGKPAATPSRVYLTNVESPELRRLGVAYFLDAKAKLNPTTAPLPLVRWESDETPIEFSTPSAERWDIRGEAKKGGKLILAVPLHRGWRAWVNGSPARINLYDRFVQSVSVPAGPFTAAFRFKPPRWLFLSILTVICWGLWFVAGFRSLVRGQ